MSDNQQIVNDPSLYIDNLVVTYASDSTLTVTAGECRDSTNTFDMSYDAATTIDCAVTGANGLDTGSLANSTWYAVYAIGDSTKYNADAFVVSADFSTPYMPAGYDILRKIGFILTDGSADILIFYVSGKGKERSYWFDAPISVLSGGASATFAEIDLSGAVPPVDALPVLIESTITPNAAGGSAIFRVLGSSATTGIAVSGSVAAVATIAMVKVLSYLDTATPKVEYKLSSASDALTLTVAGFDYFI
jgi:hypothetical protein